MTQGQTALISRTNAGIGKDVARQLAIRPESARIYIVGRPSRARRSHRWSPGSRPGVKSTSMRLRMDGSQ